MKAPVVTPRGLRQGAGQRGPGQEACSARAAPPRAEGALRLPPALRGPPPAPGRGPARGSPLGASPPLRRPPERLLPERDEALPRSPRSPLSPLPGRVTSDMAAEVASTVVAEVVESLDLSPDRLL